MKYLFLGILLTLAVARAVYIFSSSDKKMRIRRFFRELTRNIIIAYIIYYAIVLVLYLRGR